MKKLILVLSVALAMSLSACNGGGTVGPEEQSSSSATSSVVDQSSSSSEAVVDQSSSAVIEPSSSSVVVIDSVALRQAWWVEDSTAWWQEFVTRGTNRCPNGLVPATGRATTCTIVINDRPLTSIDGPYWPVFLKSGTIRVPLNAVTNVWSKYLVAEDVVCQESTRDAGICDGDSDDAVGCRSLPPGHSCLK